MEGQLSLLKDAHIKLPNEPRFQPEVLIAFDSMEAPSVFVIESEDTPYVPSKDPMAWELFEERVAVLAAGDRHNGLVNTFEDMTYDEESGELLLQIGRVGFIDYLAANTGELAHDPRIEKANPIILNAMLMTRDGKLVYGVRTPNTAVPNGSHPNTQIGPIGGMYSTINRLGLKLNPYEKVGAEICKELGITAQDFSVGLSVIYRDAVYSRTNMLFSGQIDMTAEELHEAFMNSGNKREHTDLYFVDPTPQGIDDLLKQNLTVAGTTGVALLLEGLV